MATVSKYVEFELDEITDQELFEELEDRLGSKYILHTKEHQAEKEQEIQSQIDKLNEIFNWYKDYES